MRIERRAGRWVAFDGETEVLTCWSLRNLRERLERKDYAVDGPPTDFIDALAYCAAKREECPPTDFKPFFDPESILRAMAKTGKKRSYHDAITRKGLNQKGEMINIDGDHIGDQQKSMNSKWKKLVEDVYAHKGYSGSEAYVRAKPSEDFSPWVPSSELTDGDLVHTEHGIYRV